MPEKRLHEIHVNARPRTAVLAVDAGGTYFKSAMVDRSGEVLEGSSSRDAACSGGARGDILGVYAGIFKRAVRLAEISGIKIAGVGVATPGPFDYQNGISLMEHKFAEVKGVPLRKEMRSMGVLPPGTPVFFMHDAHAFLAGERWKGALKNTADAAAVTIGTGLGFGMMKGGVILENNCGGPAVSIYNLPCGAGILEDYVSSRGIAAGFSRLSGRGHTVMNAREVAALASGNDAAALGAFLEAAEALASGIMPVLKEFRPGAVVFGGQVSKSFRFFGRFFQEKLSGRGVHIRVMPGENIEFSSLIGAAGRVFDGEKPCAPRSGGGGEKSTVNHEKKEGA